MNEEHKEFDHKKAGVADKIALIGELEHARYHALRSAVATWNEEDNSRAVGYLIKASQARQLRRAYMKKHFGEIDDPDWCLCKSAARIRQLAYEVCEGDAEELRDLDDFVDGVFEGALGIDLSDCVACKEDRDG